MTDFIKLIEFMHAAQQHVNHPKLRLKMDEGFPLHITVAGNKAKFPGSLNLTDDGPYGNNTWYGRIDARTGKVAFGQFTKQVFKDRVLDTLTVFQSDPAKYAALYGKETGACCFCGLALTDPRSDLPVHLLF